MEKGIVRCCLILTTYLLWLMSASAQTNGLQVNIKKLRNGNGVLRITLFSKEKDYLKNFASSRVVPAKSEGVTVVFDNLPAGEYAITVYHDENNNGKFDSNFIGIPKEGTCFANDASALFGPPSWDKAKFKWNAEATAQVIHLKYF